MPDCLPNLGGRQLNTSLWTRRVCAGVVLSLFSLAAAAAPTQRIIVQFQRLLNLGDVAELVKTISEQQKLELQHLRTLHTGGDVYALAQPVSADAMAALLGAFTASPLVTFAEEDRLLKRMATPNDSRYNEQWHYFEATGGLNLPAAWDTTTGTGAVVAVLDTGYRPHPDLAANIVGGYDMVSDAFVGNDGDGRDSDAQDPGDWMNASECGAGQPLSFQGSSWHGTHVAGTIAAVSNNNSGVAGVAYGAQVLPVRVLGKCGGYTSDIAEAIIWAAGGSVSGVPANAHPAQVINMSLGGGGSCDSTTQSAINTARSLGATVVVAAGNENQNASNSNPANCSGVVSVAATDRDGNRANYSNYGTVVDVAAPGGETATSSNGILSTLNTGSTTPASDSYAFYQGTSMATPHVAGAAALLYSVDNGITPDEVESALKTSARSFPGSCSGCGAGIVDAAAAIAAVTGGGGGGGGPVVLSNGQPETGLSASSGSSLSFTLEVPAGATNLAFTMSGGSGDGDMYVRHGSAPTTSTYDCRPYETGNNESCNFASPAAGTWHVLIQAYSPFSGVSLSGSFDEPAGGGGSGTLDNGVAETGLAGAQGEELAFTIDLPSGAANLVVSMSGGSGDADLYVRHGSAPTTATYDCRPYQSGNNESCSFASPAAGTWHVMLRGYSAFSGVSLVASFDEQAAPGGACAAGYAEYTGSLASSGAEQFQPDGSYYYSGAGQHLGELTGPGGADFDLYLQKYSGSSWSVVGSSESASSDESINYSGSAAYYRWRVYSYSGSGDYTLCLQTP